MADQEPRRNPSRESCSRPASIEPVILSRAASAASRRSIPGGLPEQDISEAHISKLSSNFEMPPPPPPEEPNREYPSPDPEEPTVRAEPANEPPAPEQPAKEEPIPGPSGGRERIPVPSRRQGAIIQSRSSAYSPSEDDTEGEIESDAEVRHPLSGTWVRNPHLRDQGAPQQRIPHCRREPLPEAPAAPPYEPEAPRREQVNQGAAMGDPAEITIFNAMMACLLNKNIMPQVRAVLTPQNLGIEALGERFEAVQAQQGTRIQELAPVANEAARQVNAAANYAYQTHQRIEEIDPRIQQIEEIIRTLPGLVNKARLEIQEIKGRTDSLNEMVQALDERLSRIEEKPEARAPSRAASHRTASPLSIRPDRESTHPPERDHDIPKGARVKRPEPFKGKRGQEAESFIMRMEVYFGDYPSAFMHIRKIKATLTNMGEGEASKWAKPQLSKVVAEEDHPALRTWVDFKKYFLVAFGDPIKKERAIREMGKLSQTSSAQHYASQFRILMEDLNWDERALIDRFRNGLKENVQQKILEATLLQDTDQLSLERWMELAIRTDNVLFAGRQKDGATHGKTAREPSRNQPTSSSTPEYPRVPNEEMDRRRKEGLCLKCAQKGHIIKDCWAKTYIINPKERMEKGKEAQVEPSREKEGSTDSESEN